MKYNVGDKTLLGEIEKIDGYSDGLYRYQVDDNWFSESEVDKIIIKPKRNIDHIIELLSDGQIEETNEFLARTGLDITIKSRVTASVLLNTYTEPSKYPQLTPEEIKALKLARDCGFADISRSSETDYTILFNYAKFGMDYCLCAHEVPSFTVLCDAKWINGKGQSINELLKDEV